MDWGICQPEPTLLIALTIVPALCSELGKKGAELGIKHARYRKTDGEKETVVEYDVHESELTAPP